MSQISLQQRKIIHIDMDAFFASVEQRDDPSLQGKPVAVGGSRHRGVVAAASYEARRYGVHSAMPSVIARQKCPDLIFVAPRFEAYQAVSRQIHVIFHRYTNLVEPLSLDEAYLDVTDNLQRIHAATDVALQIKLAIQQETGLTASAGVSINKFLAKIASDYQKPDGLTVIRPQQVQAFIDRLPIEKFFGVGKVTAQKMNALGIHNGRELKQWQLEALVHHFGKSGHYFYHVARGRDERPVVPDRIRKSIGAERTFAQDIHRRDKMIEALRPIAEEVEHRLIDKGLAGRTLTLKIRLSDFTLMTRSQTGINPINDRDSIFQGARRLLSHAIESGMAVRLLGITLSSLDVEQRDVQQLKLEL